MDKPSKLNERLTLTANLSVVVGIIFLAVGDREVTGDTGTGPFGSRPGPIPRV